MKFNKFIRQSLAFIFICNYLSAVTIWSENFSSYTDDSGYIGSTSGAVTNGDYPSSVSKWTLDVSAATLSATSDWFMVNNGLFETRDSDGECIWTSQSISISILKCSNFSCSY